MTTPSEPTTPTLEQRAATINELCPEGWSVRPSGSSLAIVNPGAPDAPPAVIHADDAAIVATIWRWHTEALETKWTNAVALAPGLDGMRAAFQRAMPEGYGLMHATGSDNQTYWTWVRGAPAAGRSGEMLRPWDAVVSAWTASGGGGLAKLAEVIAEFSAGMFTPADFTKRAVDVDEASRSSRSSRRRSRISWSAQEAALMKAAKRDEVPAELAPFAALALADIGHAAWLCGYHPGDDPRQVFVRAAKQRLEWMEIEALLRDDLKKARAVDPACTVESLVESIRDDAHAFADQIGKMHAELERLRADASAAAARGGQLEVERDMCWTTLRAIGLRDDETLEDFEARIAAEFEEAKQWLEWSDGFWSFDPLSPPSTRRKVLGDMLSKVSVKAPGRSPDDLRVYEMDASSLPVLASQAAALFDHLPESLEARSYDADRGASIAVRITRDPKRARVETTPGDPVARAVSIGVDLRAADPEKLAAVLSTPIEPRIAGNPVPRRSPVDQIAEQMKATLANKPAAKPDRNVLDEVRGLGEATERFDRAARLGAEQAGFLKHLADSARELGKAEGRFEDIDIRIDRAARHGLLPDGSIDAEFADEPPRLSIPVAVIADMFPLAERIVCIDPHVMVDGEHERVMLLNTGNGPSTAQDQASVVCVALPGGDINVLKNRRGQIGRWSFQPGVSFAKMVWTGTAWVPLRRPMGFAGDAPAAPTPSAERLKLDIEGSVQVRDGLVVTGIDGPVPVRAAGWTGITWMSGKGRAKSLTVPGLQTRSDLGPDALRSAEMESLSKKAIKVLQRRDRLYAFHLPDGVKRYGYVDTWGYLRAGEPLSISIRPPEIKAEPPKPVAGIRWGSGADEHFEPLPIRCDTDASDMEATVFTFRGELSADCKQAIVDQQSVTITTADGRKATGRVVRWQVHMDLPERGREWTLALAAPRVVPLPT